MDHSIQVSSRDAKVARSLARDVSAHWHERFAPLLASLIPATLSDLTLELGCYAGALTRHLAPRLDTNARIIAIEPNNAMAWVAHKELQDRENRKQLIIRAAPFEEAFDVGPRSYNNIVANLTLGDRIVDWSATAQQLQLKLQPGGRFAATMLLRESWREAEDILSETLRQMDLRDSSLALQRLQRMRPSLSGIRARMEDTLNLDKDEYVVTSRRSELLFSSARHFFATPLVVHGPMRLWRTLLRNLPIRTQQECLWRFGKSLDTYYGPRPLRSTVRVAVFAFEAPGTTTQARAPALSEAYWSRYPSLAAIGDDEDSDEFEIELEDDEAPEDDAGAATLSSSDATLADVNLSGNPKTATHPAALAPLIPDEDFLEGPLPEALDPPEKGERDLPTEDELSEDRVGEFSLEFDDED